MRLSSSVVVAAAIALLVVIATMTSSFASSSMISSSSSSNAATTTTASIFAGRSSNVVLTSDSQRDMHAFFYDRTGAFLHGIASELHASLYDVADVLTRALGVESLRADNKPSALATSLLRTSIFSRPTLAVVMSVDSLNAADVDAAHVDLASSVSAAASSARASLASADFSSVSSSLTAAASLATAAPASEHGIVSAQWHAHGRTVRAYSDANSVAAHANMADVVTQSTKGRGLTVSVSADAQFASAFAAHPQLTEAHPQWLNVKSVTREWLVEMTPAALSLLAHPHLAGAFAVKAKEGADASCAVIAELSSKESITVCSPESGSAVASTDPLFDLVSELQSVFAAPDDLRVQFVGELADRVPDVISVSIVSLHRCAQRLPAAQVAFARRLVARALPALMEQYLLLSAKSVGAVVLLDSSALTAAVTSAIEMDVRAHFPLASSAATELPNLFFVDLASGVPLASHPDCQAVNDALAPHRVSAVCVDAQLLQSSVDKSAAHSFGAMTVANYGCLNTTSSYPNVTKLFPNNTFPTNDDIGRYHAALWFSIAIALVALSAIYSIAYMQFKKDTMLYSSFNPNWEDRKRR